jgi:hypothetical protein
VVLLAGCAAVPSAGPPPAGTLPPEGVDALVRRWDAEWGAFQGLRAAIDLDVSQQGRAQRTAGALVLTATHLRFEALTPFGLPALIVVAAPERLTVFNPAERRAWTGRPSQAAMTRWLGLPVEPAALIALLLGRAPQPPDAAAVRVMDGRSPHLVFQRGSGTYRVWLGSDGNPLRVQIEDGASVTVAFERNVDGGLYGFTAEVPAQAVRARLRYLAVEAGAPPPDVFDLVIPPGVAIESVG